MAERRSVGHAYNIDFLNVVFAISNILLFVSVVWMVWDDYDREWKNTQRQFQDLEIQVTRAELTAAQRSIDRSKLAALQAQVKQGQEEIKQHQAAVDAARKQLDAADTRLLIATQAFQFTKATYDADKYDYEVLLNSNPEAAKKRKPHIDDLTKRLHETDVAMQEATAAREAANQEFGKYTKRLGGAQKAIEELQTQVTRLAKKREAISHSFVNDYFRNMPLVDFMSPTIKIQQIVTPNIVDDVNFTRIPKMDRCATCHLAIDKKGYEKYPQPFRTHSNLDAYVGSASPHPMDKFGCTVCHDGQGRSVSFMNAVHTPADPKQEEAWKEKYTWRHVELWDYPMYAKGHTEAACAKCHRQELFVPQAPTLSRAYAIIQRAGCYACHKIRGFESERKPGPSLLRISSKVSEDWVKTWIRNPRAVKPTTWMPRFWYNTNNSSPADAIRNETEIDAVAAYLVKTAEPYTPQTRPPSGRGDPTSGEKLVRALGCLGCHAVGETDRTKIGPRRSFGPPLDNLGPKVSYEWIYDWVKEPKHYLLDTKMPNLRLSDKEAADIAAYLSALKSPKNGDPPRAQPTDAERDQVLLDYLETQYSIEDAKAALKKLSQEERRVELGRRVILRSGCFSCHDIKGFEKAQAIGVELSEEGSKLVTRLDFGFVRIPETKPAWFFQKLKDSRIFDTGRILRWDEKLRMPDFGMSDAEAADLVVAIQSFQRDVQPAEVMAVATNQAAIDAGRQFLRQRNCVGCHIIEGDGGAIRSTIQDVAFAPPVLEGEGQKVQPDWLFSFIKGPTPIRPWLSVRMPTFGLTDAEVNTALRYFAATAPGPTDFPFKTFQVSATDGHLAEGKELFTLSRCQSCHVVRGQLPPNKEPADLAPDLGKAHQRLNPDWIIIWLRDPQKFQPGTRMPTFFPEGVSPYPKILGGNAEQQIEALRNYVWTLGGGPAPPARGVKVASSR